MSLTARRITSGPSSITASVVEGGSRISGHSSRLSKAPNESHTHPHSTTPPIQPITGTIQGNNARAILIRACDGTVMQRSLPPITIHNGFKTHMTIEE